MAEQERTTPEVSGAQVPPAGPVAPAEEPAAAPATRAPARKAPARKAPARKSAAATKSAARTKASAKKAPAEEGRRRSRQPREEGRPREEGPPRRRRRPRRRPPAKASASKAAPATTAPERDAASPPTSGRKRAAAKRTAQAAAGRASAAVGSAAAAGRAPDRSHGDRPPQAVGLRLRHVAAGVQRPIDALTHHRTGGPGVQPGLGHAGRALRPGEPGGSGPAPEGPRGTVGHPEPAPGHRPGLRPELPHAAVPGARSRQLGAGPRRGPAAVDGRLRPRTAAVAGHAPRGSGRRTGRPDREAAPRDRRRPGRHDARCHGHRPDARGPGPGPDAPRARPRHRWTPRASWARLSWTPPPSW